MKCKILKINSEASIALRNLSMNSLMPPIPQSPSSVTERNSPYYYARNSSFLPEQTNGKIHTLYEHMLWHYLVPNQYIYHTFHQLYQIVVDLLMPR